MDLKKEMQAQGKSLGKAIVDFVLPKSPVMRILLLGSIVVLFLAWLSGVTSADGTMLDNGKFCVAASSDGGKFTGDSGNCSGDTHGGGSEGGDSDGSSNGGDASGGPDDKCDVEGELQAVAALEAKVSSLSKNSAVTAAMTSSTSSLVASALARDAGGLSVDAIRVQLDASVDREAAKDAFCSKGDLLDSVTVEFSASVPMKLMLMPGMQVSYGTATLTSSGPFKAIASKATSTRAEGSATSTNADRALSAVVDALNQHGTQVVQENLTERLR